MDPRSRGLSYIAAAQVWPLSIPGFLSHCNESIRPLRLTLNSICLWLFWAGGGQFAKHLELLGSHQHQVQGRWPESSATEPSPAHLPAVTRGVHISCAELRAHRAAPWGSFPCSKCTGAEGQCAGIPTQVSGWVEKEKLNVMKTVISALGAGEIIQLFDITLQIALLSCTLQFLWDSLKEIKVLR